MDQAYSRGVDALRDYISDKVKNSALYTVMTKLNIMAHWIYILCVLQPIRLDRFDVRPPKYQVGVYLGSTELHAILVPKYKTAKEIADASVKEQTKALMRQIPKKYEFLKPVLEPLVETGIKAGIGDFEGSRASMASSSGLQMGM
jgi:hypothetical protein